MSEGDERQRRLLKWILNLAVYSEGLKKSGIKKNNPTDKWGKSGR
jgi:hypothetical protein